MTQTYTNKKAVRGLYVFFAIIVGAIAILFIVTTIQQENKKKEEHLNSEKAECGHTALNYELNSKGECVKINYANKQSCLNYTAGKIYTKPSDISDDFSVYSSDYTMPTYSDSTPYYYVSCYSDGGWGATKITQNTTLEYVAKYAWEQPSTSNSTKVTYTCIDVTSYDNNYDNDMFCTSSTGSQFYTNYQHADLLVNGDPSEQWDGWENYDSYDYYDF